MYINAWHYNQLLLHSLWGVRGNWGVISEREKWVQWNFKLMKNAVTVWDALKT